MPPRPFILVLVSRPARCPSDNGYASPSCCRTRTSATAAIANVPGLPEDARADRHLLIRGSSSPADKRLAKPERRQRYFATRTPPGRRAPSINARTAGSGDCRARPSPGRSRADAPAPARRPAQRHPAAPPRLPHPARESSTSTWRPRPGRHEPDPGRRCILRSKPPPEELGGAVHRQPAQVQQDGGDLDPQRHAARRASRKFSRRPAQVALLAPHQARS